MFNKKYLKKEESISCNILTNDISKEMFEKLMILLNFLFIGKEIEINEKRYCLALDIDNYPIFCLIKQNSKNEEILYPVDISFSELMNIVNFLSEENIEKMKMELNI